MKKLVRILGWAVGIFVVLLILAAIGLKLFFPVEKARAMAVERGSRMLGRPIDVKDVDLSLWGGLGIELRDVTIGSPAEMSTGDLLTADAIDLKLQLLPLLGGSYRIDRLVIDKPRIVMVKSVDGANNYTFAAVDSAAPAEVAEQLSPETKVAAAAISFDQLEIHNGSLDYVDDSSGLRIRLEGLQLSTSLENPREGFYESSGSIMAGTVVVVTEKPLPTAAVAVRYRATYDAGNAHLSIKEAQLVVNELEFSLTGDLEHGGDALKARAGIRSESIAVADLLSLLPPEQVAEFAEYTIEGDFTLDLDAEYDGGKAQPLSYAGMATLSDMVMSKKGLDGKLRLGQAQVDFKPDNLRLNIEEGSFDGQPLKGHLVVDGFDDPLVTGAISGRCDLAYISPFLPAEDEHRLTGLMDFDLKLSGRIKQVHEMTFSGTVQVPGGSYSSALLPEPFESFTLDMFFDNNVARINQFSGTMPSGQMNLSGRIDNLVPYLMADSMAQEKMEVAVDTRMDGRFNLAVINRFLPPTGEPNVGGSAEVDINLVGNMADPASFRPRGKITLSDGSLTDSRLPEPVELFEATLRVQPDTIIVDKFRLQFTTSDIAFTGKLTDPFPYLLPVESVQRARGKRPRLQFEFSSHRFDLDRLFPEAVPGSGTNRAALPADSIPPLILPDIDGRGTFTADTIIYSQVEFTGLQGKVRIEDRRISCYDVTGKVYSGDVTGSTTIDLQDFENPHYNGEYQATGIEANDFVSRFSKFGGHVFGKVNLQGSYSADGWEPDEFLNALTMDGSAEMRDGRMVTSGPLHSAIAGLAQQAGQSFEKEQILKSLKTKISVQDGRVILDNLKTGVGKLGDLELGGYYAFDGGIQYRGSLLLSREWTEQLMSQGGLVSGLAGLFADKSVERIKLPLAIDGTVDKPAVNLDFSAMGQNLGDDLTKDAGNLLKGLFKKKDKK
ncbi:MAG: AsmA family protein [bacterium]